MESRIRVLLLITCALALNGCSWWPFHRKHVEEPVPVEATAADGAAPAVVDPTVKRRKIKTPQIKHSNFEIGPYIGTFSVEDFGVNPVYGARLAYHISEDFFAEAMIGRTNAGLTSYERLSGGAQLLTSSQPGSGLGLSLASAVATLHGGELRLSDAHPGLVATLAIPARAAGGDRLAVQTPDVPQKVA